MPVDKKFLSEHYASLSDDAFEEIDPADLVDAARQCYEEERKRRAPTVPAAGRLKFTASTAPVPEVEYETDSKGKPTWLEDAACVFSALTYPGQTPTERLAQSREVLESVRIPYYEDMVPPAKEGDYSEIRLMVPGKLELHAITELEKQITNLEAEAQWRTHLEILSDDEVLAMPPEVAFGGLIDRLERLTRVYDEEVNRRGLK